MDNTTPTGTTIATPADLAAALAEEIVHIRGMQLRYQAAQRKQSLAAEREIKGFFVDWVFTRLNLKKYR